MTESEATPQDTGLEPKSSTEASAADVSQAADEPTADVSQGTGEPTADVSEAGEEEETTPNYQEEGEEKAAADYQTRLEEWDNVESSVPVVSLPVESRDIDKSDLEV
jgi:hypothetical protein